MPCCCSAFSIVYKYTHTQAATLTRQQQHVSTQKHTDTNEKAGDRSSEYSH